MHSSGCVPAARWPYAAVCFPGGGRIWSRGGGVSARGGCSAWRGPGGAWSGGGCLLPGVWYRGCLIRGGCLVRGVCSQGGVCIPACTEADTLPPPCGQNSWHTLVKILPWPNFVAAGKYYLRVVAAIWSRIFGIQITSAADSIARISFGIRVIFIIC